MNAAVFTSAASLALLSLLAGQATAAAACVGLTQNLLTSADCPSRCKNTPCVFYSPSQTVQCVTNDLTGPCYQDEAATVPDNSTPCNVTFQCLNSLGNTSRGWSLALGQSLPFYQTVTTVPVTEIKKLKCPNISDVDTVQMAGGLGNNARGDVKDIVLDESVFATGSNIVNFFVSEINLRTAINKINFSTVKWKAIAWSNANLTEVPVSIGNLSLQYIDLSKNCLKIVNDSSTKPYAKVSTFLLQENDLTDFSIELPAVTTLNLSGNPLRKIPDSVFRMANLQTLSMRNCNLTNVQLTAKQLAFLELRTVIEATLVATSCDVGRGKTIREHNEYLQQHNHHRRWRDSGVVVVGIVAFVLWRPPRPATKDGYVREGKTSITSDDADVVPGSHYKGIFSDDPDLLIVRLDHRDVKSIKLLARGGFGEVWLGLYMNEDVAIKHLRSDKKTMADVLAFASEIKIMARLEHPKIVRFIGVSWTNALTIQAVTEFMDCGDLRSLLDSSRASSLTWSNLKCQIAIDVASALVYMHSLNPELIHRDLKSRNILIDDNTGAKLSDFGISRDRSIEETMTAGVGTARWIAPEVILGGHYTEFADIYSFGVVLSELDTCKTPFHNATNTNGERLQDVTILQLVSVGELQPSFTTMCPEPIVKLARACLSFNPEQRPSPPQVAYELRKIFQDLDG